MGYHPPSPLGAPLVQYVPIPEGDAGLAVTLQHIARGIRGHNPLTDALAADFADAHPELTETELCSLIFAWVQDHMVYEEEAFANPDVSDAIATPDAIVAEIAREGEAIGDCAHYSSVLGGLYLRLGLSVSLCWVKTADPRKRPPITDHVFILVETDDGTYTADGIVPEPFGWAIPDEERLSETVVPV